jgi:molybdopterin molybdotransferase
MLSYRAARQIVTDVTLDLRHEIPSEELDLNTHLADAVGRILLQDIFADRDYPSFDRAMRDGYAVRSADVAEAPRTLRLIGECRAGTAFNGEVAMGQCVLIMTGAPIPRGADAVVMVEYTEPGPACAVDLIVFDRTARSGQNIVFAGTEAAQGNKVLRRGQRLGYAELALAAQVGSARLRVARRPTVALLSTGDEVVPIDAQPAAYQIRNSNCVSLAAQVVLSGARPVQLGNAADSLEDLHELIPQGLQEDMLVLSGGVSRGKYDLVEEVLRELGAEFLFDSVDIRPGQPAVFAKCGGKPVFGLPGNPVSTMVTFELFATLAIDILSGEDPRSTPLFRARLAAAVERTAALTHFIPARVSWESGEPIVTELTHQGSADIVGLTQSNCFLVVRPEHLRLAAGELVDVMPRRGSL